MPLASPVREGTNQVKSLQLERKVITAEVDSLADKARSNSAILANRSIVGGTPFDFFILTWGGAERHVV
jgi:hypothetical protein